jgi:hypothetical protein
VRRLSGRTRRMLYGCQARAATCGEEIDLKSRMTPSLARKAPCRSPEFFNLRSHLDSSRLLRWDTGRNSGTFYPVERPHHRGFLFRTIWLVGSGCSRSRTPGFSGLGKQVRKGSSCRVEGGRPTWAYSESTHPGLCLPFVPPSHCGDHCRYKVRAGFQESSKKSLGESTGVAKALSSKGQDGQA